MNPEDKAFEFVAGTGTLRSKITRDTVMHFGAVSLPEAGQCYIDGIRDKDATKMELQIKSKTDRTIVAHLVLPTGSDSQREGTIELVGNHKVWKVVATLREGLSGWYLVLRLPEVKIASPAAF